MTININGKQEDISAMLIGAERYALGRRTYIVQWTCEFIGNNLHLLTEKDRNVMIRDIGQADYYGDECDENSHANLLFEILRDADKKDFKLIYAPLPKKSGISLALYNRMIRAAAHKIIRL